jgi:hypothetical protein
MPRPEKAGRCAIHKVTQFEIVRLRPRGVCFGGRAILGTRATRSDKGPLASAALAGTPTAGADPRAFTAPAMFQAWWHRLEDKNGCLRLGRSASRRARKNVC